VDPTTLGDSVSGVDTSTKEALRAIARDAVAAEKSQPTP
jgi:hypothetical protein